MRALYWEEVSSSAPPREGGIELFGEWKQNDRGVVWLDLSEASEEAARRVLLDEADVHPLAVSDALKDRHPSKFELFGSHVLLILKAPRDGRPRLEDLIVGQVVMVVGERLLITRCPGSPPSLAELWGRFRSGVDDAPPSGPRLALRVCRSVVDAFAPTLLELEKRLEALEDEMIESESDEVLEELVRMRIDLKRLVRIMRYHTEVFDELLGDLPDMFADLPLEISDVDEHLERQLSLVLLYHDLSKDLVDGYISLASHRLNQVMKTLTIVTVLFVPLTLIAGIYGMNFEYMPETGWRKGYFFVLGGMALLFLLGLVYLRRRRWL